MSRSNLSRLPLNLALDLRSLAACRIALSVVLLMDLATRWREYSAFVSHDGLLTIEQWREALAETWRWTMYSWSDWEAWPACLLAVHTALAVMLLLGLWTRWTSLGCWILALSLHVRNPLAVNSGDTLLRMLLLWGAFSVWGQCWSLDQRRRAKRSAAPPRGPSAALWPSAMLAVQLTFMYVITGWLKVNDVWLGGEAMDRIVEMDYVIRPWGRALADHPAALRAITYVTPWFEIAVLLVWSPWRTAAIRTFFVFAFLAFHAGIALTINAGMFSLVSQAAWLVLLPGSFWDALGWRWEGRNHRASSAGATGEGRGARSSSAWSLLLGTIAAALAVFSLGVNSYTNLQANRWDPPRRAEALQANHSVAPSNSPHHQISLPVAVGHVADMLAFAQDWTMFRNPPLKCTWPVARAEMLDGREWDLLRDRAWKPAGEPQVAAELPSQHWRYYFRRLSFPQHHYLVDHAAQYLLDRWNKEHPEDPAARVRLVFFEKTVGQPGFQSQVLGAAGEAPEPKDPFDIDDTLRKLDSAINLP